MIAAGGSIIAIAAWLSLGLALTGAFWLVSRWLGKATVPGIRSGGGATEHIGHRHKQANSRTGVALTHPDGGL